MMDDIEANVQYLFPDHKSWAPVPRDGQLEAGYSLGVRHCHVSIRLWLPWNVTLDQAQSAFFTCSKQVYELEFTTIW